MTPVTLLQCLAEFLKEQVKNYVYYNVKGDIMPIAVYTQYLPIKTDSLVKNYPFVMPTITEVSDDTEDSSVKITIMAGIVDPDKTLYGISILNLVEHIRQALLKNQNLTMHGKIYGHMKLPLKTKLLLDQPYPEVYGYLETDWDMVQPVPELQTMFPDLLSKEDL